MKETGEWYLIRNADEIDTPCFVVYPERVKENIRIVVALRGDATMLRPHVKTHKSSEATRLMLEAGITKFKCATIAEAEMLALCKAPDVLLAYQPVGPKLARFVSLIRTYPGTQFSCLVDNAASAEQMSHAAAAASVLFRLFVDVNTGMNRTGILPGEDAAQLYLRCGELEGLRPVGLHAYDGHVRDADLDVRTKRCNGLFDAIKATSDLIQKSGSPAPVIVAGGSPTFSIHAKRSGVECSPGTFIYWDKGYADLCPEQPFHTAALVISRVVSLPGPGLVCLDLGHKSIAAESELSRRVFFLNAPDVKFVGQSEEHLVLDVGEENPYRIGDVFYGLPFHVCPTCALYEKAVTVEQGMASGAWRTLARDRVITI